MAQTPRGPRVSLKEYMLQDPPATVQFILRCITILFSFLFLTSWVRADPGINYYFIALMSGLLTFLIKLIQRKQDAQVAFFSRGFVELLAVEDSAYYVFYCFFMYNQHPSAFYLLPVLLYAVLFCAKFMSGLVQVLPSTLESVLTNLIAAIARNQSTIHKTIAYCEILIFPLLIWKVFLGAVFFLAPLLYYQFLKVKYSSRRNPSVRTALAEIKGAIQTAISHPYCPQLISSLVNKVINFFSSVQGAPGTAAQ